MSENRLMFWQRMARHYTTVMSSISKVEDSIRQSPSLVSLLDDIRRMIKNPA